MKVMVKPVLEFRRKNKDGMTSILICVSSSSKRYYFNTGVKVKAKTDFDKVLSGRYLDVELQAISERIQVKLKIARELITEMTKGNEMFDIDEFKRIFAPKPNQLDQLTNDYKYISEAFKAKLHHLKANGQLKTAQTYESAYKSLTVNNPKIKFSDVTPDWLKAYSKRMTEAGKSPTTISMYVRTLRTLFNDGISLGYIDQKAYPFGKRKFKIPAAKNIKKALTIDEIGMIARYNCPNDLQAAAKDYWMFLYLNNGMNVKDMALLKQKDYNDGVITFIRAKTETTAKEIEPISIPVSLETKEIIKRLGKISINQNDYLFPILNRKMNESEKMRAIQQTVQNINKNMAKITAELSLPKTTTYTARHSYATVLLHSGQSIAFIGKQLGHTDTKTTENYLKSFDLEKTREANAVLTQF